MTMGNEKVRCETGIDMQRLQKAVDKALLVSDAIGDELTPCTVEVWASEISSFYGLSEIEYFIVVGLMVFNTSGPKGE